MVAKQVKRSSLRLLRLPYGKVCHTDWRMAQMDAPKILPMSYTSPRAQQLYATHDTMTLLYPASLPDVTKADRDGMV